MTTAEQGPPSISPRSRNNFNKKQHRKITTTASSTLIPSTSTIPSSSSATTPTTHSLSSESTTFTTIATTATATDTTTTTITTPDQHHHLHHQQYHHHHQQQLYHRMNHHHHHHYDYTHQQYQQQDASGSNNYVVDNNHNGCVNFLFLSPHCPPHFKEFALRLYALPNVNVLGIADVPFDELPEEYKNGSAMTEYYYVEDMEQYEQVYRAVGFFIHKYGRISFVESHNEHWLELEARLRSDYNIPTGYHIQEQLKYRKKSVMKELFRQINVPVAKGRIVNSVEEAYRFMAEEHVGFPVILKKDTGVGCCGTYKIHNDHELRDFFVHKWTPRSDIDSYEEEEEDDDDAYLMEEFIHGATVTFDGMTDQRGRIAFFASTEYSAPVIETVATKAEASCFIHRHVPEDLRELGYRIVHALNLRARFFHIEFFRTIPDGRLVIIEANLRIPGGYISDMWNHAHQFDIYQEYADMITCRGRYSNPHSLYPIHNPRFFTCFVGRRPNRNYRHSLEDILRAFPDIDDEPHRCCLVQHHPLPQLNAGMGNYAFIFRSEDRASMLRALDYVKAKLYEDHNNNNNNNDSNDDGNRRT